MRRQRSIVVFLIVMLGSAAHAFAQSSAEPPPAPRKAPTPVPAAVNGVRHSQPLGFGDDGESGAYAYDGSGNITAIGLDTFLYDAEGRLKTAVVRGVTGSYSYDAFGNRKTATGETNCYGQTVCATPLTVNSSTNRLSTTTNSSGTTTNVTYDAAGNITGVTGGSYTYDGTGMMTEATVGSDDRQFVYTADDERIAVRQGVSWTWTVRGMDNKVLREFTSTEPNSNSAGFPTPGGQWKKDYVWRDGLLLASTDTTGTYHYHLDHLGTPRLITNTSGVKIAEHAYYPFGAEISLTPHESTEEAMKFTGHERDTVAGDGHTLDDMHARYYNASLGRFLSFDPILLAKASQRSPQRWNRYAYASDNPLRFIDPTGLLTYVARVLGANVTVHINDELEEKTQLLLKQKIDDSFKKINAGAGSLTKPEQKILSSIRLLTVDRAASGVNTNTAEFHYNDVHLATGGPDKFAIDYIHDSKHVENDKNGLSELYQNWFRGGMHQNYNQLDETDASVFAIRVGAKLDLDPDAIFGYQSVLFDGICNHRWWFSAADGDKQ
ncbi:MAG: hypothetical protein QOC81_4130 [Thermoanaerobaculia bacterium]|jgi:RHS repeat-associated protein|nr:hypothetical protein [Thermoanaerobaculia bacterium]